MQESDSQIKVGDFVRLIDKQKYYSEVRKGSKGKVLQIGASINQFCYWVQFKNKTEQMLECQLEKW